MLADATYPGNELFFSGLRIQRFACGVVVGYLGVAGVKCILLLHQSEGTESQRESWRARAWRCCRLSGAGGGGEFAARPGARRAGAVVIRRRRRTGFGPHSPTVLRQAGPEAELRALARDNTQMLISQLWQLWQLRTVRWSVVRASVQEAHLHVGRGEWPVAVLVGLQARREPYQGMAAPRA